MTPAYHILSMAVDMGYFPRKIMLADLFVVTGRRFPGGIRTAGPSDDLWNYDVGSTYSHTGTIYPFIYHPESLFSNNCVFTYTCSSFNYRSSFLHGPCSTDTQ